jgi:ribonuclease BN (tRNA processing enzyme)
VNTKHKLASALAALVLSVTVHAQDMTCASQGMALQLLGSGGPISDDARASSGSVIWINGKSRLLFDAGGGTYLRFGQAGARLEDLNFIGISHFHTDHVADLPSLLKGAYFMAAEHSLTLAGPKGSSNFPSMTQFYNALFAKPGGAFAYLNGLHDGSDGLMLTVHPIDVDNQSPQSVLVYKDDEVKIYAFGIPHGDVPTLAYRIEGQKGTIVISADQNGHRPGFAEFAKGADILVMPAAIDEDADAESQFMHAPPSIVGQIAAKAQPKLLVLNHLMGKSLRDENKNLKIVKQYYHGPVYDARDLSCYSVPVTLTENSHEH